uniref:Uncharacterized protein n=1 Tax=Bracon brevicornis TaxID=1563983 RepID=A0A6V7M0M1_9HYME
MSPKREKPDWILLIFTILFYLLRDLDADLDLERRGVRSLESDLPLLRDRPRLSLALLLRDRLRDDERERLLLRDLDRDLE